VLQRFSLSGELFTQPPGNPGDRVEGDGRVGGQPDISPAGDGEPFVGVVEGGRGAQRCGGDDGVETAGEPRRRRMEEVDGDGRGACTGRRCGGGGLGGDGRCIASWGSFSGGLGRRRGGSGCGGSGSLWAM
jgi:hypothetical protein